MSVFNDLIIIVLIPASFVLVLVTRVVSEVFDRMRILKNFHDPQV